MASPLLSLIIIAGIFFQFFVIVTLWRVYIALRARYAFYLVRDELIELVALGKIKEKDPVFQTFYRWSNDLARDAKNLNLKLLVKALMRQEPADPELQAILTRIIDYPPEVKDVLVNFTSSIINVILWSNIIVAILFHVFILIKSKAKKLAVEDRYMDIQVCQQARAAYEWQKEKNRLVLVFEKA